MARTVFEIGEQGELKANELEVNVSLRGEVGAVVKALTSGLPADVLQGLAEALEAECRKRNIKLGSDFVDATLDQDPLTPHARAVRQLQEKDSVGRLHDGSE